MKAVSVESDVPMACSFLEGGGESGQLIEGFDWSATSIGSVATWSQSLKTMLGFLLRSPVPIVMLWGEDGVMLYNDAYSMFAAGRHPQLLGSKVREGWPEVADFNDNVMKVGLAGGTLAYKDQELTLYRHGRPEQVWMNLDYSPVLDERGRPVGVLCILAETTERVAAERERQAAETSLRDGEARFRALVNASSDVVYRMSPDWTELRQLDGRGFVSDTETPSVRWLDAYLFPEDRPQVAAAVDEAVRTRGVFELEHRVRRVDGTAGWTVSRAIPVLDADGGIVEWFGMASDVTERRRAEALRAAQNRVLELVARDASLLDTLDAIVRTVEEVSDSGVVASILLLDDDGMHLRHGAGPHLPDAYNDAIDGIAIGPNVGSCGTAVHLKEPVYVANIATDPLWADFRDLALLHGLRACWSTPILGREGRVLGTFAMYYREPREPNPADLEVVDFVVRSAALVVERKAAEDRLRLLAAVVEQASDFVGIASPEGVGRYVNRGGKRMVGLPDDYDISGVSILDFFAAEDRSFVEEVILPAQVKHGEWSGEFRFRRFDTGEPVPVLYNPFVIRDPGGGITAYATVTRDITERKRAEEALAASEAKFQAIVNSIDQMIWSTRPDGFHDYYNDRWYEYTGVPHGSTDGEAWNGMFHPDDQERAWELWRRSLASGEPYYIEYRLRHSTGSYRWVIGRAQCVRDEAGRITRWFGTCTDVEDLKQAEGALRASETRYRTLFENIDVGFCVVEMKFDSHGRAIDYRLAEINPAFERQTGLYGAAGKWVSEVAPGLERHWFDTYGKVALTGEAVRFENRAESFGRWYDVHAFRAGDPRERRVAILFHDITVRRGAEDALHELNETLEQQVAERTADRDRLWRSSQDLLLIARFDSTMVAVNPAWTAALGWSEDELIGASFMEFIHPDDLAASEAEAASLSAEGRTAMRFENRYRAKSGDWVWLSWAVSSSAGLYHAVARDVTADKAREAELLAAQEALRQSQKMEAVGQLTGGIAHDFNNLLTGVIGSLDMMQRRMAKGETDKIDRYATTAMTAANRAAALTHRLLAFSRRQPLDPKPVDANRLVSGMEELLRRTIGESVSLEIVTAGGLWQTLCDPHQLESAILNLAINARDAMPDGGKLTIETGNAHLDSAYAAQQREVNPGQYVCISVTDTGTGMSKETMEKAFEPFFTTKPIGQGTGLGLSMIYGFTRQSEGYARIYSEIGRGSTFKLYLPRYYGEADVVEEQHGELTDAHRAEAGEVVLVVEDEAAVRDLVVDVLEELGYRAVEAVDGPSGLKLLQSKMRLDLLVTDIGLPGLNGRQVADAARELRPNLKVLFMTGYAENATIANGFLEPGMEMITKPFAIDALATRIRKMIEER